MWSTCGFVGPVTCFTLFVAAMTAAISSTDCSMSKLKLPSEYTGASKTTAISVGMIRPPPKASVIARMPSLLSTPDDIPLMKSKLVSALRKMYVVGTEMRSAATSTVLAWLMEKVAALWKYPRCPWDLLSMTFSANLYQRAPRVGQNIRFPNSIMSEGTRVSATRRDMPIAKPMMMPMVFIMENSAMPRAKNDIITVAPLVVMLSPAHVTEVLTASSLLCPLMRSSLYLATMNIA